MCYIVLQIYIGKGLFVEKSGLVKVEMKRNFKSRMAGVVKLVWPDGNVQDYNLAGSDGKKSVENYQVNAVHSKYPKELPQFSYHLSICLNP